MYAQKQKTNITENQSVANSVAQTRNNNKQGAGLVDNRSDLPLQRYVFINDEQIIPDSPEDLELGSEGKKMVRDRIARNFVSPEEFMSYLAGATQYLGTIKEGIYANTWVRFSKDKMNVLGERHTEFPLSAVTNAVGSTSFRHERFTEAATDFGENTRMVEAIENEPRYQEYGVGDEVNKELLHRGEALLPKIAYVLKDLVHFTEKNLSDWTLEKFNHEGTKADAYIGKPNLTYLKSAVALMFDVLPNIGMYGEGMQMILADILEDISAHEELFQKILHAAPGMFLGDLIAKEDIPAVKNFAKNFMDYAFVSMQLDPSYKEFSYVNEQLPRGIYMKWRDSYMIQNVKQAYEQNVKYFGMGRTHYLNLQGNIADLGMDVNLVDLVDYMPKAQAKSEELVRRGDEAAERRRNTRMYTSLKDLNKVIKKLA